MFKVKSKSTGMVYNVLSVYRKDEWGIDTEFLIYTDSNTFKWVNSKDYLLA